MALITDAALRQFFILLKSKILLILGYRALATNELDGVLQSDDQPPKVALEARYLQIFVRADPCNFAAVKSSYQDLIADLEQRGDEHAANFYKLE